MNFSVAAIATVEEELAQGATPPPDYVMSRYADGRVASRYGELKWDWTPYSPQGRHLALNFVFWSNTHKPSPARELLLAEMQFIMYLLIRKRPGATLSAETLRRYVELLREMARFCEHRGLCIGYILGDPDHLLSYATGQSANRLERIGSLLSNLGGIGVQELGYQVLGEQMEIKLREVAQQYFAPARQYPPIPTRIYSQIISSVMQELTEFESVAEAYLGLAGQCVRDPWLGRSKDTLRRAGRQPAAPTGREIRVPELLAQYGLADYFKAKALASSTQGLARGLRRIQIVARLTVHVFTGMRDEEVSSLQYSCLEVTRRHGKEHFALVGSTTKLNHGRAKTVRWVTNQDAARAVRIAQRITDLCHRAFTEQGDPTQRTPETVPLFAAVSYLGLLGRKVISRQRRMLPGRHWHFRNFSDLRVLLQPMIEEADLRELEQIDPHRAWRSEERFKRGIRWTLTSHQLRRSLALYAQRSGWVSLPSLRRQLQHVTEEMSRYYTRGSTCAKNIIGGYKNHFGREWQEAQPVSAAMSYLYNVLLTDEVLFGAHGNWVERQVRGSDGTVVIDREATLRRFKKGELAYRETSLGGCASTETCDKLPIGWLNIECVKGCKNFVGRLPKLEQAIVAQTKLIGSLHPKSAEFRIENEDLEVLRKAREKVLQRTAELA